MRCSLNRIAERELQQTPLLLPVVLRRTGCPRCRSNGASFTERHSPLHSLATPNILEVCYLETQKGTFQHCKTKAQVTNAQQGRLQNEGTGASCRTRIGRPWTETV